MEKQDPTQEITVGDIDYQAMEFAYEKRAEQDAGAPPGTPWWWWAPARSA